MTLFATALAVNALILCVYSKRPLHILQLNNYRSGEYFAHLWREKRKFVPEFAVSAGGAAAALAFYLLFPKHEIGFYSIGLSPYFSAAIGLTLKTLLVKTKKPPVFTARLKRLYGIHCASIVLLHALYIALSFIFSFQFSVFSSYILVPCTLFALPPLAALSALAAAPVENRINRRFILAARRKLDTMPDLIRIGITGSFGKTSVKNFLAAMLAGTFKVCASPASFNTPLGLAKTVNENLKPDDRILIAEMGARKVGDIRELCALIRPQYGILNIVGVQHLATFKTEKNILRAKYELIEGLAPPALAVFNCDGEKTALLYERYSGEKRAVGGAPVHAKARDRDDSYGRYDLSYKNVRTTAEGSSFTLRYGEQNIRCATRLLGEHNVSNLCAAAALALELGVPASAIAEAVKTVAPVPHRLELIRSGGGVTVIDDAYNSNPDGFRAAVYVLSRFAGGRRILITPGFAEMGAKTREENRNAGACAVSGADILLALGSGGSDLADGWLSANGAADGVFVLPDLNAAAEWIKRNARAGDAVLFENDIPDF
ncbi:Mur ligase [Clostridia bacterium]|nr:Mur ligase [Clostridia bacterium]